MFSHGHWWLIDRDFNTSFDLLVVGGLGATPVEVMVPVPGRVRITKKLPDNFQID